MLVMFSPIFVAESHNSNLRLKNGINFDIQDIESSVPPSFEHQH